LEVVTEQYYVVMWVYRSSAEKIISLGNKWKVGSLYEMKDLENTVIHQNPVFKTWGMKDWLIH
jgi:hypothetical protein